MQADVSYVPYIQPLTSFRSPGHVPYYNMTTPSQNAPSQGRAASRNALQEWSDLEDQQAAYSSYDHQSRRPHESSVMSKGNNESSVIQSLIEQNKTQLDLIQSLSNSFYPPPHILGQTLEFLKTQNSDFRRENDELKLQI